MKARRTLKQQLLEARKVIRVKSKQLADLWARNFELVQQSRVNAEAINVLAKTNMRLQAALEIQRAGFPVDQPVTERPAVGEVVESFDQ